VPAAHIRTAAAAAPAETDRTAELAALEEAEKQKQAEHDAAIKRNDYKRAGELLEEIQKTQDARRRLARGDRGAARARAREAHQKRLDELHSDYSKQAVSHIEEMQAKTRKMAA